MGPVSADEDEKDYSLSAQGEGGGITILVSGSVRLESMQKFAADIENILKEKKPSRIKIDLSKLDYMDSAGALVFLKMQTGEITGGKPAELINISDQAKGVLDLLNPESLKIKEKTPEKPGFFRRVGEISLGIANGFHKVMNFIGELLYSLGYSIFHPRSVRWDRVFFYLNRVGVEGFLIICVIGFLMGFVIALMAASQLSQIGGAAYVPSATAIGMVKQFGPLIAAILVAGRSGSSFAAEIGTMVVNQEVDALTVMGFDRTRFLVLPKMIASLIAVPLLTMYANAAGILGGLLVAVTATDYSTVSFIRQIPTAIDAFDLTMSLVKAGIFAIIIAAVGCQRGFQVRGGAEAVGRQTTSAVVWALSLILLSDTAVGLALHYLRHKA